MAQPKPKILQLFLTDKREDTKCSACGWPSSRYYGLGTTPKTARGDFLAVIGDTDWNGIGLCAECMANLLAKSKYLIVSGQS